jgi:hypothetical protein
VQYRYSLLKCRWTPEPRSAGAGNKRSSQHTAEVQFTERTRSAATMPEDLIPKQAGLVEAFP